MTEENALAKLDKAQIRAIADARRSIPIPTIVRAGQIARDMMVRTKEGHEALRAATNLATRTVREAGVDDALTIITFQVACEEYVTAEYVKADIDPYYYDTLSFAVRTVLDPAGIEHLKGSLTRMRLPEEKQPVPTSNPQPIKPIKPKKEKTERKRSAKSDTKTAAQEAQAWLDD